MKLTYTNVNGYLIPNLTYKSGEQMVQLGKYGFLRRDYLKNHRNSTYQVMLLQDTIGEHLLEVEKAAREREEVILKQLEEKEPLPDKEAGQMAWVRAANQHCGRDYSQGIDLCLNEGEEVVDYDLIIICEYEIAVGRMKELG